MRRKTDKQYVLNRETLDYDVVKQPSTFQRYLKTVLLYAFSSVSVFVLSLYLLTDVFEMKTPRRLLVERDAKEWHSKLDLQQRRLESASAVLADMERRDNSLYRSVFGMERIPEDIRNAGYGGVDRYADIRERDYTGELTSAVMLSDMLLKKAYVQSKSFDQVMLVSERAAEMALCAPTIPPVNYAHVRQARTVTEGIWESTWRPSLGSRVSRYTLQATEWSRLWAMMPAVTAGMCWWITASDTRPATRI